MPLPDPTPFGMEYQRIIDDDDKLTSFIKATYEMVSNPENQHLVSWNEEGTSFVIHDPVRLNGILRTYYKHAQLTSLQRQLNMYCFQKQKAPHRYEFFHHYFRRGQPQLLHAIKRKCSPKKSTARRKAARLRLLRQRSDHFRDSDEYVQTRSGRFSASCSDHGPQPLGCDSPVLPRHRTTSSSASTTCRFTRHTPDQSHTTSPRARSIFDLSATHVTPWVDRTLPGGMSWRRVPASGGDSVLGKRAREQEDEKATADMLLNEDENSTRTDDAASEPATSSNPPLPLPDGTCTLSDILLAPSALSPEPALLDSRWSFVDPLLGHSKLLDPLTSATNVVHVSTTVDHHCQSLVDHRHVTRSPTTTPHSLPALCTPSSSPGVSSPPSGSSPVDVRLAGGTDLLLRSPPTKRFKACDDAVPFGLPTLLSDSDPSRCSYDVGFASFVEDILTADEPQRAGGALGPLLSVHAVPDLEDLGVPLAVALAAW